MTQALDFLSKSIPISPPTDITNYGDNAPEVEANVYTPGGGLTNGYAQGAVYAVYDGENGMGEMGPPKIYAKDFYVLRVRSKQLYLESPICQAVINRFTQWVIGRKLKLQAEPQTDVLAKEKITVDPETFNKSIESLWKVYSGSKICDYAGLQNMHSLCEEAHREAKLGGDMLVILRVVKGFVKVQHIDGSHIGNPPNCAPTYSEDKLIGNPSFSGFDYINPDNGNRIRYGVEIDDSGAHVAYHVRVGITLKYVRVAARDSKGMVRAFMLYGFKPEIDSTRGTPLLSVVLETAKKLERYNSAALAGAEERAKIPIFFVHGADSDNEDPLAGRKAKALIRQPLDGGAVATGLAVDALGNKIANDTAVSTERTVINLPNDVTIQSPDSKQDLYVKEFTMVHIDIICAAINMPPNVAMSKYEDSFSASRMAGKDWEHTFMTERSDFAMQYLNPIYALQTYVWVLQNKVQAPGYLNAIATDNYIATEAYLSTRWVGDMFPDIDPLKTIKYIREALGVAFEHVPIMTTEMAAEIIGEGGDISSIIAQCGEELKLTQAAGIELPEQNELAPDKADDPKEGQTKRVKKG